MSVAKQPIRHDRLFAEVRNRHGRLEIVACFWPGNAKFDQSLWIACGFKSQFGTQWQTNIVSVVRLFVYFRYASLATTLVKLHFSRCSVTSCSPPHLSLFFQNLFCCFDGRFSFHSWFWFIFIYVYLRAVSYFVTSVQGRHITSFPFTGVRCFSPKQRFRGWPSSDVAHPLSNSHVTVSMRRFE